MECKWTVYGKRADFKAIGDKYNIDQVVARVIRNRDIVDEEDIDRYLHGTYKNLYAPDMMADMDKACRIMSEKIRQGKAIRIISDYDVDGVTSNYILYDALKRLGADVSYEIPDRIIDGYGINERIINDAHEDGIDTIITCDNGIAAFSAIALAKELGMTVIVTDHHEIPYDIGKDGERKYKLVAADAVVDMKRQDCSYPFKELCGAGVAYKFIRHLYHIMNVSWDNDERYMDILAIGTVCDVMSLTDENRIFVKYGLKLIERTGIVGLKALLSVNGLIGKKINVYHIGFIIGPCINATGRLESAKKGLSLLLEEDEKKAQSLASELFDLNVSRKDMTNKGVEEAFSIVEKELNNDNVLVVYMPKLHESLAGIVAGRVRERFYKPVLVVTDGEGDLLKGSGRSIEGYNMYDELNAVSDLLVKFGGHEMAAGFSMKKENLDSMRRLLNENERLSDDDLTPVMRIDVPMPTRYISFDLIEDLELLEPFGKGNEKPVFAESGLKIKRITRFGSDGQYVRIKFMDRDGNTIDAVDFDGNKLIESIKLWFSEAECVKMEKGLSNCVELDVAYYPEINDFNDKKRIQIKPLAYRKHEE